jgi:hypothetical protein
MAGNQQTLETPCRSAKKSKPQAEFLTPAAVFKINGKIRRHFYKHRGSSRKYRKAVV